MLKYHVNVRDVTIVTEMGRKQAASILETEHWCGHCFGVSHTLDHCESTDSTKAVFCHTSRGNVCRHRVSAGVRITITNTTSHQVSSFGQGSTSQQPPASEPSRAAAAARKSISHDPPPRRTLGPRVGRLLLLAALAGCCRVRGSGRPVPGPGSARGQQLPTPHQTLANCNLMIRQVLPSPARTS